MVKMYELLILAFHELNANAMHATENAQISPPWNPKQPKTPSKSFSLKNENNDFAPAVIWS